MIYIIPDRYKVEAYQSEAYKAQKKAEAEQEKETRVVEGTSNT